MKQLTIVIPNRNRIDPSSNFTRLQIESFNSQTCKDFDITIVDGGSKNIKDIEVYCDKNNITLLKHDLTDKWNKPLLNNVGIRNVKTPYIMTTDADIFFAEEFVENLVKLLAPNNFVESRTQYACGGVMAKIYKKEIDPIRNTEHRKLGRTKKRTTCGGLQCSHIDLWTKVRGYDERYLGWGSEDMDLMCRMGISGARIVWMGEAIAGNVLVFHQPHNKEDAKRDLDDQRRNLGMLGSIREYVANKNGWGGIKDSDV